MTAALDEATALMEWIPNKVFFYECVEIYIGVFKILNIYNYDGRKTKKKKYKTTIDF